MENKLIPMTDFVLEQSKNPPLEEYNQVNETFVNKVINYAEFLIQPLTLGMFVPCDDQGTVLQELPEETGKYQTEYGERDFNEENGLFYDGIEGHVSNPSFYFEEVPDREDEMKEILETYIKEFKAFNFSAETFKRAEQILKELS